MLEILSDVYLSRKKNKVIAYRCCWFAKKRTSKKAKTGGGPRLNVGHVLGEGKPSPNGVASLSASHNYLQLYQYSDY